MLEQHGVQMLAADGVAVVRHARALGKRQFPGAGAEHRHPVHAVIGGHLVGEAHLLQVADGTCGEPVTAGLGAGNSALSTTSTLAPVWAAAQAAADPEGHPPAMTRSYRCVTSASHLRYGLRCRVVS